MGETPQQSLDSFFSETDIFLEKLLSIQKTEFLKIEFIEKEMVTQVLFAYNEVKPHFTSAKNKAQKIKDEILKVVGLTGQQLALKMQGFFNALREFSKSGLVRKIFDWLKIILGSLISAALAYTGLDLLEDLEPIKEFIEAVEASLSKSAL